MVGGLKATQNLKKGKGITMKRAEKNQQLSAMAFYNPHGFVAAYKQAKAFGGETGRVATIPDIIEARMATKPGDVPWENYYTTMSAEYVGFSKGGNPIAIVLHGVGPMSTLDGVLAAYSFQFNDKDRNRRGGRIPQEEFLRIESGAYGDATVVDLRHTWNRREYQFSGHAVTAWEIYDEPLWLARLGKSGRDYAEYHTKCAQRWHREQASFDPENKYRLQSHGEYCTRRRAMHLRLAEESSNPCILAMDAPSNCNYSSMQMFVHWMDSSPGTAIAHLLSIGGLVQSHHDYYPREYKDREPRESLVSDVNGHGWSDGTRLVGIRGGVEIIVGIHPGISNYRQLVQTQIEKLWKPNPEGSKDTKNGFWHLVEVGNRHFTDYPKQGECMDNHEPEFLVTEKEQIGHPRKFRTTIGGYHGFFKYGIDEVKRLAPPEANAYKVGEIEIEWQGGNPTHHIGPVTFYKVAVDTSQRLVRSDDIYRDGKLLMSLIAD